MIVCVFVGMRVCICICLCVGVLERLRVYLFAKLSDCLFMLLCGLLSVWVFACVRCRVCRFVCVIACVLMLVCLFVCAFACLCLCT